MGHNGLAVGAVEHEGERRFVDLRERFDLLAVHA